MMTQVLAEPSQVGDGGQHLLTLQTGGGQGEGDGGPVPKSSRPQSPLIHPWMFKRLFKRIFSCRIS